MSRSVLAVGVLAVMAALLPFAFPRPMPTISIEGFPGWPAQLDGMELIPDEVDGREQVEIAAFPGRVARFRAGKRIVVLHWVARRTRLFHFSELCLRGGGWRLEPQPIEIDGQGRAWGVYRAERGGRRMKLRQRIVSAVDSTRSFTEASSWFWAFLDGDDPGGPYWAVSIAEAWSGS